MIELISETPWIAEELKTADFGDVRLTRRLGNLYEALSHQPTQSIPTACGSWAETKAAYRFFDNDKVTPDVILQGHLDATISRMQYHKVVLMPQDTTELDYSTKKNVKGLGHIAASEHRKGYFFHPTLALTTERLCLGVIHSKIWTRAEFRKPVARKKRTITEKESYCWLESFNKTKEIATQLPNVQLVNIADREGDIFEFFLETQDDRSDRPNNAHFIIRAAQDRILVNNEDNLWDRMAKGKLVGSAEFLMPARGNEAARLVKQEVRVAEITLKSPRRAGERLADATIRAVYAIEVDAPEGKKPVEWLLLTSLVIESEEEAMNVLEWYLCRWQIEIYFKIIKSGCEIEELQLESIEKLTVCLAVYTVIAWRILYITMIGRQCPDMCCSKVFEESEWKSVHMIIHRKPPPEKPPTLDEMIRMIASLGGFLNRKGDGYPGVQCMWIGMQRTRDFALAWQIFYAPETVE